MKLIIAGGRDYTDGEAMLSEINKMNGTILPKNGTGIELVCGMARGADMTAFTLFNAAGFPIHKYAADWDKYDKRAGFIRNSEMADVADMLIAFWDGQSRGTRHMIQCMIDRNKPYHVINY